MSEEQRVELAVVRLGDAEVSEVDLAERGRGKTGVGEGRHRLVDGLVEVPSSQRLTDDEPVIRLRWRCQQVGVGGLGVGSGVGVGGVAGNVVVRNGDLQWRPLPIKIWFHCGLGANTPTPRLYSFHAATIVCGVYSNVKEVEPFAGIVLRASPLAAADGVLPSNNWIATRPS